MNFRQYSPLCHGPLEGLDYGAERPFFEWSAPDIWRSMVSWLALDPPRLELATLANEELKKRGKIGKANALFAGADLVPISWLAEARKAVQASMPKGAIGRDRGSVYVILRWGYVEKNGLYGAYVGSTQKRVEQRFIEHRIGKNGARGLLKYGIEPLYSLISGLNCFPGKECLARETLLHKTLQGIVPRVTGDTLEEGPESAQ